MPQRDQAMASAYGFGLFPLPTFRPASRGEWRIRTHLPGLGDGYLGSAAIESRAVLTRGHEVWMSTGLLEQESHAWHVHCARGVVIAAGLGMGMYAYAAALKPDVDRVIAAEVSPDLIALMREAADFERWPCRDKVSIVEADVLRNDFAACVAECSDGRPIDYLYADIWPRLSAAEAPAQTAAMVRAVRPAAAGWWGQELEFARHCTRTRCPMDEAALRACFTAAGVPAPAFTSGYAAFCRDVAAAHGMGEYKPFWQRLKDAWRSR